MTSSHRRQPSRAARYRLGLVFMVLLAGCANMAAPQPPPAPQPPSAAWVRPTPRPPIATTTRIINVSNMVGTDDAPALSIHPTRGWAAVLWVNHDLDNAPTSSTVYVKTQD